MRSNSTVRFAPLAIAAALFGCSLTKAIGEEEDLPAWIHAHYSKQEVRIPMRDGAHLFASIYSPIDRPDQPETHPILLNRTPYSCAPYGADQFRTSLGPSELFAKNGYIVVYSDVRGRYLSEGEFDNMRPHVDAVASGKGVDESSDTYDTIDWLLQNIPNHNGRVGMWGISYPGFYAAAGMIDAHPNLLAVSPQAPIADWWFDDFHHNGAFFLPHAFNFLATFGRPRPQPTTENAKAFDHGIVDGYEFFLRLGSLKHADERYFKGDVAFWNDLTHHPNYDAYWAARDLRPHLHHVAPAVLTVGGWFDAEDLFGALNIYRTVERENPGSWNALVMGPWRHGGWARMDGDRLGDQRFGDKTSVWYRETVEFKFFEHFLRSEGAPPCDLPEATVFETGTNRWRAFDAWPPAGVARHRLDFHGGGVLAMDQPASETEARDSFVSDPSHPVPFTEDVAIGMTAEYMTDDQRFASRRPDVLTYRTEPLTADVTLAGPIDVDLFVSTTGTDCDWIVKLIDVYPDDAKCPDELPHGHSWSAAQMMVRSESFRGRFRDGKEHPKPFVPNEVAHVGFPLQDVLHTFAKGHRIMVQVQSTWFPLVDRNPQKYVDNIYLCDDADFTVATHSLWRDSAHRSGLSIGVLSPP